MTRINSTRAVKALLTAAALLALTLFAAANFVLVDVQLPGGVVRLRLAWVAVVPSLCAFAVGLASARLQERALRGRSAAVAAGADEKGHERGGEPRAETRADRSARGRLTQRRRLRRA